MYLAIDIGATKTLIALFSARGRVIRRVKFPTAQGCKTFLTALATNLAGFTKYQIQAVVAAIPGTVQKNCSVVFGNRNWGEVDMLTPIKKLFNCPIFFENDANLATIYESEGLPGKTVFLTFSTGIGGGVAENGKLVDEGFEPGHEIYVYDGKVAEWEDLAAASAIEKVYHVDKATDLHHKRELTDIAGRIYLGLPDIVQRFHPDTIVLGGPMGKIFWLYSRYLPKFAGVKYAPPKRPNESVIYGEYLYALQKLGEKPPVPQDKLSQLQDLMEVRTNLEKALATGKKKAKEAGEGLKREAKKMLGAGDEIKKEVAKASAVVGRIRKKLDSLSRKVPKK